MNSTLVILTFNYVLIINSRFVHTLGPSERGLFTQKSSSQPN
uniref:Uncharacterized protein n=1 Tax=Rhizophora mucronata TaxID=61149 RepID=A0A2P2JAI3_RHIMU